MRSSSFFYSKTTSLYLFILLFFQFAFIHNASGTAREKVGEKFPFVGLIKYENGLVCTGFLIKHGVLATAKHCFSHRDINSLNFEPTKLKVSFFTEKEDPFFPQLPLIIENNDILRLVLDSGANDIAYIIYKREATINKIKLPKMDVNLHKDLSDETHVFRVGFPMGENHVFDKVISKDCQFTGKTDFFRPTITDPGYEGLLYDTNCPAWYGDSGGPVFEAYKNESQKETMVIHGVLTHTFEVNFAGEIEESSKERDSIGEFVKTSNFSPFRLADDYISTLDEEERLFNQRNSLLKEEEEEEEEEVEKEVEDALKENKIQNDSEIEVLINSEDEREITNVQDELTTKPEEEKGLILSVIELLTKIINLLFQIIKAS